MPPDERKKRTSREVEERSEGKGGTSETTDDPSQEAANLGTT